MLSALQVIKTVLKLNLNRPRIQKLNFKKEYMTSKHYKKL